MRMWAEDSDHMAEWGSHDGAIDHHSTAIRSLRGRLQRRLFAGSEASKHAPLSMPGDFLLNTEGLLRRAMQFIRQWRAGLSQNAVPVYRSCRRSASGGARLHKRRNQ